MAGVATVNFDNIVLNNIETLLLSMPSFRGLWRSRCIQADASYIEGWSVTFVRDGEYCETPYCKSPSGALRSAMDRIFLDSIDQKDASRRGGGGDG